MIMKKIIDDLTQTRIKKFRPNQDKGKHGDALFWPLNIVQLIMEMLVHGNTPTSIVPEILLCSSILNNSTEVHEFLGVNFISVCRTYIHNLFTILYD